MYIPGVPSNIALINGPMLLGYLFSYGFLGILVAQAYIYYTHFPTDRLGIKILVWTVLWIEIITSIFMTHAAFVTLGAGWGDLSTLTKPYWSLNSLPALSGFVSSMVHAFFCWRIWVLGRIWPLCIFLMVCSLVQWGLASYVGFKLWALGDMRLIHTLWLEIVIWLAGSAMVDTIIASSMVFFLFRAKAQASIRTTNSIITRLIKLTVETGFITACDAICDFVFFLVIPDNNIHFIFFLILAKLYSNSLLATLNSRISSREPLSIPNENIELCDDESQITTDTVSRGRIPSKNMSRAGGVQITTTTERHPDAVQMVSLSSNADADVFRAKGGMDPKVSKFESV